MRRRFLLTIALLAWPAFAHAAQITVCASGCTYTNAQVQNALNAANNGDEVLLEKAFQYNAPSDSYKIGVRCTAPNWDCITVRTGVTSTGTIMARTDFPPDGVRMNPLLLQCLGMTVSCRGVFAKLLPTANNVPQIRTVYPGETGAGLCSATPCVANGWSLKWLEFGPKDDWLQRPFVHFGTNADIGDIGDTQDKLSEVPHYLSIVQCDFHGHPDGGQFDGLLVSSAETRIIGNSFRDFKNTEQQGQAIIGLNGIGPVLMENNHIEASGENIIFGGADSQLQARATITGSPSTTVIAMNTPVWLHTNSATETANFTTDIFSGIYVAVIHGGITYAGTACTLSGVSATAATCTLSNPLPFTPSVGDFVRWGWMFGGLTFRYNHFYKPPEWKDPILAMPTGISVTGSTSAGSLAPGTYCYRAQAWVFIAGGGYQHGLPAAEQCATLASTGQVTITWSPVAHASIMVIWGRASGAQNQHWNITVPTTTYVDTGVAGATDISLEDSAKYWYVLNNFELKHCDGASPAGACLIEYNVMDYSWCCSQDNIVSIKVNDQAGRDVSATLRNLTFQHNLIRHGGRALNLQGGHTENQPSGQMLDVQIRNNLWLDLSNAWSADRNSGMAMSSGNYPYQVATRQCIRCTIQHNTFLTATNDMHGPMQIYLNGADKLVDFVVRDNIMPRDATDASTVGNGVASLKTYIDDVSQPNGTASWNAATMGASFADHNAWPEGSAGVYTAGPFTTSFFYPDATIKSYMVNYATCAADGDITNCALTGATPLDSAASDLTDVGANIAAIKIGTDIALAGDTNTEGPPPPPSATGGPRLRLRLRGGDTK